MSTSRRTGAGACVEVITTHTLILDVKWKNQKIHIADS